MANLVPEATEAMNNVADTLMATGKSLGNVAGAPFEAFGNATFQFGNHALVGMANAGTGIASTTAGIGNFLFSIMSALWVLLQYGIGIAAPIGLVYALVKVATTYVLPLIG